MKLNFLVYELPGIVRGNLRAIRRLQFGREDDLHEDLKKVARWSRKLERSRARKERKHGQ